MTNTLPEDHIELLRAGPASNVVFVAVQLIESLNPGSDRDDLNFLESSLWMVQSLLSDQESFVGRFSDQLRGTPK